MVKQRVRKCQCDSSSHGHRPGKCNELATERDALCKRCSEKRQRSSRLRPIFPGRVGISIGRDTEPSDLEWVPSWAPPGSQN